MNKVSFLLKNKFTLFCLEDQLKIKCLGRELPDLNIAKPQTDKSSRCRKFNRALYTKNNWICGCDVTNKMYCFPCVLFGGDEHWAETGVDDLIHVWEKMRIHEKSMRHMHNVFSLAVLGKVDIKILSNSALRTELLNQNEQVQKNRHALDQIINGIRFCSAFDLALRGQERTEASQTNTVFKELINFNEELDKDIKERIKKIPFFKGMSKSIQNDLLECIFDACHDEIIKEVKSTSYVAIVVDETTDITCKYRLIVILRYLINGKPVERFWNILYPEAYDAETVSNCILKEIEPLVGETPDKLISLSYDGPSIVSGSLAIIQSKFKEKYPLANYLHYYGHSLNAIISSAASVNKQARIFFTSLCSLCSFISNSPQVITVLNEIVQKRLYKLPMWNFDASGGGVKTVYDYRKDLIVVMDFLEKSSNDATVNQAGGYKFRLQDKKFIFWLGIFNKVIPHVEIVFKQLQKEGIDPIKKRDELRKFEQSILNIQQTLDIIISDIENEINSSVDFEDEDEPGAIKKPRLLNHEKRREEALEVCNSIIRHINIRFNFLGHLMATTLFKVVNFKEYRMTFPNKYLDETVKHFSFLDKVKLKNELQVVYERPELRVITGAVPLLSLVIDEELRYTYQELLKLLSVLCTMPMETTETERCFSVLPKVKTFLRNTAKVENLCALALLSVEKGFVNDIDDFNHKVIDLFATKKKRLEFVYRKV